MSDVFMTRARTLFDELENTGSDGETYNLETIIEESKKILQTRFENSGYDETFETIIENVSRAGVESLDMSPISCVSENKTKFGHLMATKTNGMNLYELCEDILFRYIREELESYFKNLEIHEGLKSHEEGVLYTDTLVLMGIENHLRGMINKVCDHLINKPVKLSPNKSLEIKMQLDVFKEQEGVSFKHHIGQSYGSDQSHNRDELIWGFSKLMDIMSDMIRNGHIAMHADRNGHNEYFIPEELLKKLNQISEAISDKRKD